MEFLEMLENWSYDSQTCVLDLTIACRLPAQNSMDISIHMLYIRHLPTNNPMNTTELLCRFSLPLSLDDFCSQHTASAPYKAI